MTGLLLAVLALLAAAAAIAALIDHARSTPVRQTTASSAVATRTHSSSRIGRPPDAAEETPPREETPAAVEALPRSPAADAGARRARLDPLHKEKGSVRYVDEAVR